LKEGNEGAETYGGEYGMREVLLRKERKADEEVVYCKTRGLLWQGNLLELVVAGKEGR